MLSQYAEIIASGYITFITMFLLLAFIFYKADFQFDDDPVNIQRQQWNRDLDLQNKWIDRIENKIAEQGYAHTLDFHSTVGLDVTYYDQWAQIEWALQTYFYYHEQYGAKISALSDAQIDDPDGYKYIVACRYVAYY